MSTFLAFRIAAKRICSATPPRTRPLHVSAPTHSSKYNNNKPRNEKIPFSEVHLVDIENGGQLVKMALSDVLAKTDKDQFFVELQSSEPFPVVKLVNRKEAAERRKNYKESQKLNTKKNVVKEFQFTWGMAMGDLEHKLDRAKEELRKGSRVNLVFAQKQGKKGAGIPVKDMRERMELVANKMADAGIEWKDRELQRGIGALFYKSLGAEHQQQQEEE